MIRLLFHDAIINNKATKPFGFHRGVRQGYHLAPYLIIITLEALNVVVKHAMGIGNLGGITLQQGNSQQIISQYVDDTSFTVKAEETSVGYLIGILHKFGTTFGLEINWHKSVAHWCGRGRPPGCVGKYQWKWVAAIDLSKLLGTLFGLQLELQDVDQFFVNMVKGKLSSTRALPTCHLQDKPSSSTKS